MPLVKLRKQEPIRAEQFDPIRKGTWPAGVRIYQKQVPTFDEFDSPWQNFFAIEDHNRNKVEVYANNWIVRDHGLILVLAEHIFEERYERVDG